MTVIEFPKAHAKSKRITQQELESLRWSAEINALRDGATKAERDLVEALEELMERREAEHWGEFHG